MSCTTVTVLTSLFAFSCADSQAAQLSAIDRANKKFDSASAAVQKHNYHHAFKQIHKLAKQGHPTAQHLLGMMYENGVGVGRNMSKALAYYEKSAMQDFGDAQCALGRIYHDGNEVVVKDAEKAREWLTKAAQKNVPEAEYKLGMMHANGDGVPQDLEKAGQYLQSASTQGVEEAKDALAKLPPLPNYQAGSVNSFNGGDGQNSGPGLNSLQQAWTGYGAMVKNLNSANGGIN